MSTITIAQFVARFFLPCLALAIGVAFVWRAFERGPLQTTLQIIAALLFFVPQLLSLFLANDSVELLVYERGTLAAWGYGITALLVYRLWTGHMPGAWGATAAKVYRGAGRSLGSGQTLAAISARTVGPRDRYWTSGKIALGLCFSLLLSGLTSWYLVGDYLLPRITIEGYVERAAYHSGARSMGWYEVFVSGKRYRVTRDLLATMHPGEPIRAQIGAGSGTILSYARLEAGMP